VGFFNAQPEIQNLIKPLVVSWGYESITPSKSQFVNHVPLPVDSDIASLKARLYDEYRVEVPLIEWNKMKLIRVSIQGCNSKRDVDRLLKALTIPLNKG
jgi:isopenicillin-N epimerase